MVEYRVPWVISTASACADCGDVPVPHMRYLPIYQFIPSRRLNSVTSPVILGPHYRDSVSCHINTTAPPYWSRRVRPLPHRPSQKTTSPAPTADDASLPFDNSAVSRVFIRRFSLWLSSSSSFPRDLQVVALGTARDCARMGTSSLGCSHVGFAVGTSISYPATWKLRSRCREGSALHIATTHSWPLSLGRASCALCFRSLLTTSRESSLTRPAPRAVCEPAPLPH